MLVIVWIKKGAQGVKVSDARTAVIFFFFRKIFNQLPDYAQLNAEQNMDFYPFLNIDM
jgi:hypothetical protein